MRTSKRLLKLLDGYATRLQSLGQYQPLMDSNRVVHITRMFPLWRDEWIDDTSFVRLGGHPWWAPFNVFLHKWHSSDGGMPHNHPRWNMTLVLTGGLTEVCDRRVHFHRPGSMIWRSPKSFHKLFLPPAFKDETYTLFFVGRRNYTQQLLKPDGTTMNWHPFDHWIDGRAWDAPPEKKPQLYLEV